MSYLTVKVDMSDWGIDTKLASAAMKAEHAVAVEAMGDTMRYVPRLNGVLQNSTQVVDNLIIYPSPARFLYYGKLMVDPQTGSAWAKKSHKKVVVQDKNLVLAHPGLDPDATAFWFETSKAQNLDKWKRVMAKAVTREL